MYDTSSFIIVLNYYEWILKSEMGRFLITNFPDKVYISLFFLKDSKIKVKNIFFEEIFLRDLSKGSTFANLQLLPFMFLLL